jgi:hypothetical protein
MHVGQASEACGRSPCDRTDGKSCNSFVARSQFAVCILLHDLDRRLPYVDLGLPIAWRLFGRVKYNPCNITCRWSCDDGVRILVTWHE